MIAIAMVTSRLQPIFKTVKDNFGEFT